MTSLDRHGRQTRRRSPDQEHDLLKERKSAPQEIEQIDQDEEILKAFDLDHSFGPSCGISRLERWERAKMLGKNPPEAVKRLIEQHPSDTSYTEGLWSRYNIM